jgi:hypothetical protein
MLVPANAPPPPTTPPLQIKQQIVSMTTAFDSQVETFTGQADAQFARVEKFQPLADRFDGYRYTVRPAAC